MSHWWNYTDKEKLAYSKKNTTNPARMGRGSNPSLRGKRPVLTAIESPRTFQVGFIEAFLERSICHGSWTSCDLEHTLLQACGRHQMQSAYLPSGTYSSYCNSMVTICHGNTTTVDRSFPSHIKDYAFTEGMVYTICRLILRHCIDCPNNTLMKKWPNRS